MNKNSLLIVYDNLGLGGVERKIVDIINYASSHNDFSDIPIQLILKNKPAVTMEKDLNYPLCRVHHYPRYLPKGFSIFYLCYLCLMIIRYKPPIIFVFMHQPIFYLACIKKILFWIPFDIILSHEVVLSFYNTKPHSFVYPNWLLQYIFRVPRLIIVQTEFNKNEIIRFEVDPNKIVVIPNWILEKPKEISHKLYDFIYCGRFALEKQLHKMITIIELLKTNNPHIHGCFVGDGAELSKIRELIRKKSLEENILIKPYTNNVFSYLTRAKIFFLTSSFENFPMTILEAMASGAVPVILAFPGVEEFVVYGKTGFYENSIELIAERALHLLKHEENRKSISRQAKQEVLRYDHRLIQKTWNYVRLTSLNILI